MYYRIFYCTFWAQSYLKFLHSTIFQLLLYSKFSCHHWMASLLAYLKQFFLIRTFTLKLLMDVIDFPILFWNRCTTYSCTRKRFNLNFLIFYQFTCFWHYFKINKPQSLVFTFCNISDEFGRQIVSRYFFSQRKRNEA